MDKDLSIQILEYVNSNTANHNQIDIIPHFKEHLYTLAERTDFKNVIKQLKNDKLIITGTSYVMISVQGPPNGSVLTPLNSLEIKVSITIKGQTFLRELDPSRWVHVENSVNTIVGSHSSFNVGHSTNSNVVNRPTKKLTKHQKIIVGIIIAVLGTLISACVNHFFLHWV